MSLFRPLFLLFLIVSLTACQLYFIDRDDDDDDDRSGGTATLTLRIQGTEEAGFREIGLRIHGVELQGEDRTESFDIPERTVLLYEGGGVLLSGVEVRAQQYNRVRLRLRGDGVSTGLSFVDDGLTGGELPIDVGSTGRQDFSTGFTLTRNRSQTVTLVVHAASAFLFEEPDTGLDFFSMRPAGYAVRHGRGGFLEGTIPNVCSSGRPDDVAVYVFNPDADPRDIRGNLGAANEPVASFAARSDLSFRSPRLPAGDWLASYTCNALDDDPDDVDRNIADELRDNACSVTVEREETVSLDFAAC
ncbi:MAG: hypothetical protein JJT90_08230 [Ectothiorhodospiraceae bacterium]|nr:hypothetical protein [Ectothiorhodospiraceae bacterium]